MGYRINNDGSISREDIASNERNTTKPIDELSLQECYEILRNDKANQLVKQQYKKELKRWHEEEKSNYEKCKSISDYKKFIKRYNESVLFYKMQYKEEALHQIETLYWGKTKHSLIGCHRYLSTYPNGKYVEETRNQKRLIKRNIWIIITCIFTVALIVCALGYKSGSIILSQDALQFSKFGESQTITFTIKGKLGHFWEHEISNKAKDWLSMETNNQEITFKTTPNTNGERKTSVVIVYYSTFWGEKVLKKEKIISIRQESGVTTEIQINHIEQSEYPSIYTITPNGVYFGKIECKTFHHTSNTFNITTDGVANVYVSSEQKWIDVVKKNDSIYTILTRENKDYQRKGAVSISAGEIKKSIEVFQPSGMALKIKVNHSVIHIAKEGFWEPKNTTAEGGRIKRFTSYLHSQEIPWYSHEWELPDINRGWKIIVECDGYWDLYNVPEWMYARLYDTGKEKGIIFWARPNFSNIERRATLKVYTSTDKSELIDIIQSGD